MAKTVFKETIGGERGLSGWSVKGVFHTGYSPDELAKKLGIPEGEWEVILLPQPKKKGMKVVKRPEADDDHFGY